MTNIVCPTHGLVRLSDGEVVRQLSSPWSVWRCTICSRVSKSQGVELKTFSTESFSFKDDRAPCSYWGDMKHIVANGACRCGRKFAVVQL